MTTNALPGTGPSPAVDVHDLAGSDQRIGVRLGRLEVGQRAEGQLGAVGGGRDPCRGRLGCRETTVGMDRRRLVGEVPADQGGHPDDRDGAACHRCPSAPGLAGPRHRAPAPRPTSVKTIGSAKAW